MVIGHSDGTVRLWCPPTDTGAVELVGDGAHVFGTEWTADARRVVLRTASGATVWDPRTGARLNEPVPDAAQLTARPPTGWVVSRSPDLRTVRVVAPPSATELDRRRALARPDADRHRAERAAARAAKDPVAEAFHKQWAERAPRRAP